MAKATVTVTGKTGPGSTVTSLVITDVQAVVVNIEKQVFQIFKGPLGGAPYKEIDMAQTVTFTDTIAGAGLNHTIVISS